jgi:hypothetical protein
MSAVAETEVIEHPVMGKPSRKAIRAYRESVFDGTCDEGTLFNARQIRAEWERDRRTYQARVRACEILTVDVPRLEKAVAETAKGLAEAETFARSPIPDSMSVAQLRERIRAVNPSLSAGSPDELAAGLLFLADTLPTGALGTLYLKAAAARNDLDDMRSRSRRTLIETGAETVVDPQSRKLSERITRLREAIAARSPTLDAEAAAKRQRAICERIAAGDVEPPKEYAGSVARFYRGARTTLDRLLDLVAGKADAVAANQRDQEELAVLQGKIGEARQAALLRAADPRAMRWCGDE